MDKEFWFHAFTFVALIIAIEAVVDLSKLKKKVKELEDKLKSK